MAYTKIHKGTKLGKCVLGAPNVRKAITAARKACEKKLKKTSTRRRKKTTYKRVRGRKISQIDVKEHYKF